MSTAVILVVTLLLTCVCSSVNINTPSQQQESTLLVRNTTPSLRQLLALESFKKRLLEELGMNSPPKVGPMLPEDEEVLNERTQGCPGSCVYQFPTPFSGDPECHECLLNNKTMAFDFGSSDYPSSSNRPITSATFILDLIHPSTIPTSQYPLNIIFKIYHTNETDVNITKKLEQTQERYFEADITELVIAWQSRERGDLVLVGMVLDEEGNLIDANDVFKANNNTKRLKNFRSHLLKLTLARRNF